MKRRTLKISLLQQAYSDNLNANRAKLEHAIAQACAQTDKLSQLDNDDVRLIVKIVVYHRVGSVHRYDYKLVHNLLDKGLINNSILRL